MSDWARDRIARMDKESDGRPVAFVGFSEEAFPIHMEVFDDATGELLWEQTVDGSGAVEVPGQRRPVRTRVTYLGTGRRVTVGPDGQVIALETVGR